MKTPDLRAMMNENDVLCLVETENGAVFIILQVLKVTFTKVNCDCIIYLNDISNGVFLC